MNADDTWNAHVLILCIGACPAMQVFRMCECNVICNTHVTALCIGTCPQCRCFVCANAMSKLQKDIHDVVFADRINFVMRIHVDQVVCFIVATQRPVADNLANLLMDEDHLSGMRGRISLYVCPVLLFDAFP